MSVSARFSRFLENLKLTDAQKADGATKRESVVKALNQHYWNSSSDTSNSKFVGSWAKRTRIRPPRDVDVLFELPSSVHTRFEGRLGNKQSQLLQEVRNVLGSSFSRTAIKGDGPVVLVPFGTYSVELIPTFRRMGGGYLVCMTTNGGWYKHEDYDAQVTAMSQSDSASNCNTRDLVRMMKRWQAHCSVPLKSFYIELLAIAFLNTWGNRGKSKEWYDFMCRDFFQYIYGRQNTYVYLYSALPTRTSWRNVIAIEEITHLIRKVHHCLHLRGIPFHVSAGQLLVRFVGYSKLSKSNCCRGNTHLAIL